MNTEQSKKWYSDEKLIRAVISVYIIGTIGFLVPQTQSLFIHLTTLTLLFSLIVMLIAQKKHLINRHWLIFILIYLAGFGIEVLGINTGWPFGNYVYGDVLGIKILETPLFIGINWLLLVLATHAMARHRIEKKWLVPVAGASMMLIFDVALEPFAVFTEMWYWQSGNIPFANYLAWWIIGFIMHWLMLTVPVKKGCKVAYTVFFSQIVFFIIINVTQYF